MMATKSSSKMAAHGVFSCPGNPTILRETRIFCIIYLKFPFLLPVIILDWKLFGIQLDKTAIIFKSISPTPPTPPTLPPPQQKKPEEY